MPVSKSRTKDDTWKEADLKKALQGEKSRDRRDEKSKEKSSHRDDGRKERRSEHDDDRRRRREHKDELANGEDKDRERRRRRDRDKESDKGRKRDKDRDEETSSRDKGSRKEREKQREHEGESSGVGRGDHDDKERRERRRTKDKESDGDRERRHRSRREQEDKDSGKDEGKSRDQDRRSEKDRDRRKRREEGESSSHKDRSGDRRRDKSGERDHRERRKERHHDDSRKLRDQNQDRREKSKDRGSRERREKDESRERRERSKDRRERRKDQDKSRERQREKSRDPDDRSRRDRDREKSIKSKDHPPEGERFRADTLEKADVVEEEDNTTEKKRQSSVHRRDSINAEEVTEEGGADDYYEEDFEDYEDDFENELDDDNDDNEQGSDSIGIEERNAGMQELLKAINLENETVRTMSREGSKLSRSSDDDSKRETPVRPPTAKGRINFVAAKQKQISNKVASRTRKRGQELMHLIDLDVVMFDMFDLPPMNEYELYIKNFGRSDTKQAYVQCNDDNLEKEIQTDEIETRSMWTQNPADDFAGCGGEDGSRDEFSMMENRTNIDSVRLAQFLQSAGQVCLILLEEASADRSNTMIKEKKDLSCSDGYIPLATKQPYLAGRAVVSMHISPVQSHILLTAYGPVTDQSNASSKTSGTFNAKSVVCLWNVNEPSHPQKVLLCESVPRCCCLSPSKATIAFAGLDDGSVVAWDLRESSAIHHLINVDDAPVTLRSPTFSTAGVLSQDNHHSPVISLLPVVMPSDSAKASSSLGGSLQTDEMLGLSFQLSSLEEDAVINIWVVVELESADVAGSQSDLGLAPGGKIKLIKSACMSLELPLRGVRKTTALQALCMRFLPQDPNHFYIGTDSGSILHTVRHGGRAPPKAYKPCTECLDDVTAIDVSPWQLPYIIAGSKDGTIRLFHLNSELPHSTWSRSTKGSAIVCIQWSNSIPSVFYVLDSNSTLYIWNLLQDESSPVSIEKLKQGSVVCFELSSDYTASGIGVPGRRPELVLGYQNGIVEIHKISDRFTQASPDDLDRFHTYLEATA